MPTIITFTHEDNAAHLHHCLQNCPLTCWALHGFKRYVIIKV